jgi:hypothetical protein
MHKGMAACSELLTHSDNEQTTEFQSRFKFLKILPDKMKVDPSHECAGCRKSISLTQLQMSRKKQMVQLYSRNLP